MSRWLPLLACTGALLALDARALSPGPPRPAPPGVGTYCSNLPVPADPTEVTCGFGAGSCDDGAECIATPAGLVSGAAVRATLTVIVDEDVSGFSGGQDDVPANARLTILLEFQKGGVPTAISETFKLTESASFTFPGGTTSECAAEPDEAWLCVPSWNEPATEANLVRGLNIQWTLANPDFNRAILQALLTPAELADPNLSDARALLEVVDRENTFDHQGTDGLASIARFKVTLRVQP